MTATKLDKNRRLDELDALDSGGEGDAASVNSQEPPEILQSQQEIEAMQAAAAELKSLGIGSMQAAAAEVAGQLVRMTRAGAGDEQMLFHLAGGGLDPGEGGFGPRTGPAESVDGESLHASDLA